MSVLLADIDATCASLGCNDEDKYHAEPDAIQGLKHLIWILRRDLDNHEYRRHLGRANVLQTDLVPMLPHYIDNEDYADVLIRLLVILTNPTPLLYRDGLPKDGPGRKIYLELIDILQGYKEAFTSETIWAALSMKLQKALEVDWALRSEEQGLLIERILVQVRNVLHIPANPEVECRADNDASLHDQVIWALHQSGILDLVLYILSSADENQYHLHALEIICLMYREQSAASLADASLQRSAAEKHRDEQELIAVRRREKQRLIARPPPGRHSRFGGTYVLQNVKSVSDNDIICHQSLERAVAIDFDREKSKQKRSHRIVGEDTVSERRSAFSVRLCLREYCIEVLRSAYNTLVRQVRRVLERNIGSASHDDSYLLWAIRFFMEFNRLSGLQLPLVSESLSVQCFHWVLTRIQHDEEMIMMDKSQARLWSRRLHVAIKTFRELLLSLLDLQKLPDEKAQALFDMLLNNICYVLEYRETVLHLLMNYNEAYGTKAYLRDVVETANIFIKIMEKFCKDSVIVQDKRKHRGKGSKRSHQKGLQKANKNKDDALESLENIWAGLASEISSSLLQNLNLPEEELILPFDATSEKSIDDQKEDCMLKIHKLLREKKIEHGVVLMRAAREVWPEDDCFGVISASPEDELMILREIFLSNLSSVRPKAASTSEKDNECENSVTENEEEEEEEDEPETVEKDFRFEDFAKRLVNPKVVRACTIVLTDWESISTKSLKSAVTILYRIAYECKCPAMLYQAALFKIFQKVFDVPKEAHHEELRRLGVFVVRRFIETAPSNPKIFAELLFYKTIREANELESGYGDTYNAGTKGAWTEEQENELRMLFEENQSNPQTDQDVIDWILDNLIDKTRTRRGILKKLKEMNLVFKKPTKKSFVTSKNLWQHEEDEQLRTLYDEYRLEDDCLDKIVNVLEGHRTKNHIIKRMIQLHLIADSSEILPKKQKKQKTKRNRTTSDSDNGEIFDITENLPSSNTARPKKNRNLKGKSKRVPERKQRKIVKTPLDIRSVKVLMNEIDDKYQEAIEWLRECLTDAAKDIGEPSDDPDDGVPLVPLQEIEKDAMEDSQFKKLMISIGIQPPIEEMENYWRIPVYLTAADLQMRANVISGIHIEEEGIAIDQNLQNRNDDENDNSVEEDEEEEEEEDNGDVEDAGDQEEMEKEEEKQEDENQKNNETSDEHDLHGNFLSKRRERLNNLVFNKSDNEDEHREPLKPKKTRKEKDIKSNEKKSGKKHGKFNLNEMVMKSGNNEHDNDDNDDDILNSQNLRKRLAELTDSDNSDMEEKEEDTEMKSPSHILTRKRLNVIESESSADEMENTVLTLESDRNSIVSANKEAPIESSQHDSKGHEDNQSLDVATVNNDNATIIVTSHQQLSIENTFSDGNSLPEKKCSKRGRFEDSDESDVESYATLKRKKANTSEFQRRKLTIIDDDEDEDE